MDYSSMMMKHQRQLQHNVLLGLTTIVVVVSLYNAQFVVVEAWENTICPTSSWIVNLDIDNDRAYCCPLATDIYISQLEKCFSATGYGTEIRNSNQNCRVGQGFSNDNSYIDTATDQRLCHKADSVSVAEFPITTSPTISPNPTTPPTPIPTAPPTVFGETFEPTSPPTLPPTPRPTPAPTTPQQIPTDDAVIRLGEVEESLTSFEILINEESSIGISFSRGLLDDVATSAQVATNGQLFVMNVGGIKSSDCISDLSDPPPFAITTESLIACPSNGSNCWMVSLTNTDTWVGSSIEVISRENTYEFCMVLELRLALGNNAEDDYVSLVTRSYKFIVSGIGGGIITSTTNDINLEELDLTNTQTEYTTQIELGNILTNSDLIMTGIPEQVNFGSRLTFTIQAPNEKYNFTNIDDFTAMYNGEGTHGTSTYIFQHNLYEVNKVQRNQYDLAFYLPEILFDPITNTNTTMQLQFAITYTYDSSYNGDVIVLRQIQEQQADYYNTNTKRGGEEKEYNTETHNIFEHQQQRQLHRRNLRGSPQSISSLTTTNTTPQETNTMDVSIPLQVVHFSKTNQ